MFEIIWIILSIIYLYSSWIKNKSAMNGLASPPHGNSHDLLVQITIKSHISII